MVVVGAGPAGLMAALTLGAYDVEVLLLDKRGGSGQVSRALVASARTLELLRRFGFEDAVRATAVDVAPCAWVTPNLGSGEGRQEPLGYPIGAAAARVSPTAPLWAPQHLWEPLLLERLKALPQVSVRLRCEVESVSLFDDGALVAFIDAATHQREQVTTSYVVAADGAHSVVRRDLGIAMDGPDNLAEVDRVEFRADVEAAVGRLGCGLNVVTDPEVGGVLAPRDSEGRWGVTRDAGATPRFADMDGGRLADYVRRLLGVGSLDVEVEGVRTFRFAAQLARAFRCGPVFLAGDAAHRVTPRGGTGMNTAIQDGFDLGWKLGFVLSDWAGADLLDTYEAERCPVAAHNVERSASTSGAIQSAEEALSWDLRGRIAHHWISPNISTTDLPGPGMTLLVGPSAERNLVGGRGPIDAHVLDRRVCHALGLATAGGVLLRPDGKLVRQWTKLDTGIDPWEQLTGATRALLRARNAPLR